MAKRNSQTDRLLGLLLARRGDWIPAYQVADVGGLQYGARIHTLRERGHVILNRIEHHQGQTLSWFKLEESPPLRLDSAPTPLSRELREQKAEASELETLFGPLGPDRTYLE